MCCAVALPGFARSPRAERLWASSWCPPHSTAQAAACRFVKESGAGWWSSTADAVSAAPASPSGTCGGGAWPWAAHPRVAMVERVPSASVIAFGYVGSLYFFLLDPEADPEAGPPTPRALYSVQRSEALRGIAIRWGERCASPGEC